MVLGALCIIPLLGRLYIKHLAPHAIINPGMILKKWFHIGFILFCKLRSLLRSSKLSMNFSGDVQAVECIACASFFGEETSSLFPLVLLRFLPFACFVSSSSARPNGAGPSFVVIYLL